MGLYILPRYNMNTTSDARRQRPASTRRAPNHSTRQVPIATITSTIGVKLCFQPPGPQRQFDIFQALFFEALLLVVLARKRLDHAHRSQDFLHDRRNSPSFFRTCREDFLINRV